MPDTDTAAQAVPAAPPAKPAPLVLPAAHFTDRAKVTRAVTLAYPVTFAGRDWTAIHLRRLSVAQIAAVFTHHSEAVAADPDAKLSLPIFVDETGAELPAGLLDELDPDDAEEVNKAVEGFLPRRFKVQTGPSEPSPPTGASTSDSSSG